MVFGSGGCLYKRCVEFRARTGQSGCSVLRILDEIRQLVLVGVSIIFEFQTRFSSKGLPFHWVHLMVSLAGVYCKFPVSLGRSSSSFHGQTCTAFSGEKCDLRIWERKSNSYQARARQITDYGRNCTENYQTPPLFRFRSPRSGWSNFDLVVVPPRLVFCF